MKLTHLDEQGKVKMVDITGKPATPREARARVEIIMQPETLRMIAAGEVAKGEVLAAARLAGIMAAKQTGFLIPLCHPLLLKHVSIKFHFDEERSALEIETEVRTEGATGVEMEALTAAAIAALTVYDMCKAVDKGMIINRLRLIEKKGGKSGRFFREEEEAWEE